MPGRRCIVTRCAQDAMRENCMAVSRTSGKDPLLQAQAWLEEAFRSEPSDANAAALATADADGAPNARMVLVKEISGGAEGGAVFYTNLGSAKGQELESNPRAALVLHWKSMERQLRLRGQVEPVSAEEADAYFASRPYLSRIGAWASYQSRRLESRPKLLARVAQMTARYPDNPPRPPHWSGFRLRPLVVEFWQGGSYRLHNRDQWSRDGIDGGGWRRRKLQP